MEKSVVIAGIGGQGAILAGTLLGRYITEKLNLSASLRVFYTSQTMGGPSKAEVKISDSELIYPVVEEIDYLVALHSWPLEDREISKMLKPEAIVIYNSNIIKEPPKDLRSYGVPMSEIAHEVGNPRAVNMAGLGALIKVMGMFDPQGFAEFIEELFSGEIGRSNKEALMRGYREVKLE